MNKELTGERHGQIRRDADRFLGGGDDTTLIIDPGGFPKRESHAVGVDRQWCGRLSKVDNFQVAVFAALVNSRDAALTDRSVLIL
ncbi:MAG: transposase [Acidobacteriota bacterium]|nr:transposase [Acidobacteriota bacterium]